MSMRTPDWYRRLRALERRIDNQSTDIARLWNWAPQMPEQPGHFMPQIVPGTTAPPSTTTTTSTTTTSTTTTSGPPTTTTTTSTTSTPPPMCIEWPYQVTFTMSGLVGDVGHPCRSAENGTWTCTRYSCGEYSEDSYSAVYRSQNVNGCNAADSDRYYVIVRIAGTVATIQAYYTSSNMLFLGTSSVASGVGGFELIGITVSLPRYGTCPSDYAGSCPSSITVQFSSI